MAKRSLKLHDTLRESVFEDDDARVEYEAFKLQLELADKMKTSREKLHLTQQDIADKLHTQKSVIARLEAAGGKGKHSPSLKTLARYAAAIGYNLEIKLRPVV